MQMRGKQIYRSAAASGSDLKWESGAPSDQLHLDNPFPKTSPRSQARLFSCRCDMFCRAQPLFSIVRPQRPLITGA